MAEQNYKNHVRFYAPHHFLFYPLLMAAIFLALKCMQAHPEQKDLWIAIIIGGFFIGWLSFMMRQHYGLKNQDRIIRLELRFRYYVITHQRMEPLEEKLSFRQLAAIRFASDEQLPALIQQALQENLSAQQIKQRVRQWQPDYMRL